MAVVLTATSETSGDASWDAANGVRFVDVTNPGEILVGTVIGANTETGFAATYTIPANTLVVGSLLRVRAKLLVPVDTNTPDLTIRLKLGGIGGVPAMVVGPTTVAAGDTFSFDMTFAFRTVGATPDISGIGWRTDIGSTSAVLSEGGPVFGLALPTTAGIEALITAEFDAAELASVQLNSFIVEIT